MGESLLTTLAATPDVWKITMRSAQAMVVTESPAAMLNTVVEVTDVLFKLRNPLLMVSASPAAQVQLAQ